LNFGVILSALTLYETGGDLKSRHKFIS